MLLCTVCTFAQDRVITKNGDVFDAYRVNIGNTYVYPTIAEEDAREWYIGASCMRLRKQTRCWIRWINNRFLIG